MPDTILHSGVYNIKGMTAKETPAEASTAARNALFTDPDMCQHIIDNMLEEYEREA